MVIMRLCKNIYEKFKKFSRRDKWCPRENGKFILKGGVKCKIKTKNKNKKIKRRKNEKD